MGFKKSQVDALNLLVGLLSSKYRPEKRKVVKLFAERKIHTLDEAKKTIRMLDSKHKTQNIQGLARLEHHNEQVHASESHKVQERQKHTNTNNV